MASQPITDIDTLLLQVRDLNSQNLIRDAISAYHGGALRSAVISTWNAVTNDIIVKARELHNHGEPTYRNFIDSLDKAIEADNIQKKTKIEREILDTAKDDFQIITPHEYELLARLKSDRNICAHPSLVAEDQLFEPTPDLVRAHIVNALSILLIHAPLQGKGALKRFRNELLSDSFPSTKDAVREFVFLKYLDRSKDAFVENLIRLIMKSLFHGIDSEIATKKYELVWILSEIYMKKPIIFKKVLQAFFSQQVSITDDRYMLGIFAFLGVEPTIWGWINKPVKFKIIALIESCAFEDLESNHVFDAYYVPELKHVLYKRLQESNYEHKIRIILKYPHKDFIPIALETYSRSGNFRGAEAFGQNMIVPLASKFGKDDVIEFMDVVLKNNQIYDAIGTPEIIRKVFEKTATHIKFTQNQWRDFLIRLIGHCDYNPQAVSIFQSMLSTLENSTEPAPNDDTPL